MNNEMIYSMIYALAARDGREAALFGRCGPLAREALCRSLATDAFPEIWFEVPLAGDPWFDLHALTSREDLVPGMAFAPERTGGWPEVFEWFACADGVRQLALSYDVSAGDREHPAVQLLVKTRNADVTCGFLEAAGRPDAVFAYRAFTERLPRDWFACYAGVFPARQGAAQGADAHSGNACAPVAQGADARSNKAWTRVECIPAEEMQAAYASDGALLESHLRQVGLTDIGDTLVKRCQRLARTPFQLEFQFDVMPDGNAGATFGASVRFAKPPGDGTWQSFASAATIDLMRDIESWGLADERWHLLGETAFSKRIERGSELHMVFCLPTFVKLRWRKGEPLDAKAYLIAGVQNS